MHNKTGLLPLNYVMPFVNEILKHRSLSIVGMEKNTGKTVCLNYILRRLHQEGASVAVTSIGIDGERTDQVYGSAKPEIILYEGMRFITSEKHYLVRQLLSEIEEIDTYRTSLGRLVTAKVLCQGKILLSGAATTDKLRRQIAHLAPTTDLTIVDGALSRMSLASPTVTEAMILATGAAVSPNIQQLVQKTAFVFDLISLPETDAEAKALFSDKETGVWYSDTAGQPHDLGLSSALMIAGVDGSFLHDCSRIFVAGVLNDVFLKYLMTQGKTDVALVVKDFTKIFVTPEIYRGFCKKGGRVEVLQRSRLIAVTVNPTSPQGYRLHSDDICHALEDRLHIPVYDVMKQ